MAENTDAADEPLEDPIESKQDASPGKDIPDTEPVKLIPTQEIEKMDIHAHHLHKAPGQGWRHYVFEFLMLFLAVFAGFMAENQREKFVEHKREKQYIRSLTRDIKTDTANITKWLIQFNRIHKSSDTLLEYFDDGILLFSVPFSNNYNAVLNGYPDFVYTDRTMQQLKNAGGMRLIENSPASDSIIDYDAYVRYVLIQETQISSYFDQLNSLSNKIFSYRKYANPLQLQNSEDAVNRNFWITKDSVQFEQLYNLFYKYQLIIRTYIRVLNQLKNKGERLIAFLQKEYDLE